MLVLKCTPHERITIGSNIKVTIIKSRHGYVSLGISAPKDIPVLRSSAILRTPRPPKT